MRRQRHERSDALDITRGNCYRRLDMDEKKDVIAKREWSVEEFEWSPSELRASRKATPCTSEAVSSLGRGKAEHIHGIKVLKQTCRKGNAPNKACESDGQRQVCCDVPGCVNTCTGTYYRKYRVCQEHAKSPVITIHGQPVRFCQKCAKLEPLSAFDGEYRSCRVTLERHNKRRRLRNAAKGKLARGIRNESSPKKDSAAKANGVEHPGFSSGFEICGSKKIGDVFDLNNILMRDVIVGSDQSKAPSKDRQLKNARDLDFTLFGSDPNMDRDLYKSEDVEFQLSLKFQNGSPEDLPGNLLDDIAGSIPSISWIEGSIRPGCTHVATSIRMNRDDYNQFIKTKPIMTLAGDFYSKWRGLKSLSKGFQMQINDCSAQLTSDGSHVITRSSLSKIISISPCVIESDAPAVVEVVGQFIDSPKLVAFCRQNGKYLTTTLLADVDSEDDSDAYDSDDSNMSDASSLSSNSVSYQYSDTSEDFGTRPDIYTVYHKRSIKILGLRPGVCEIELLHDNMLTESVPVLALPSAKSVEEARSIIAQQKDVEGCKSLIRDIGMVVRHACSIEPLPNHMILLVRQIASRTITYCMEHRANHLVGLLQMALREEYGLYTGKQPREHRLDGTDQCVQAMNYKLINELNKKVSQMEIQTSSLDCKWRNILGQLMIGIGLIFLAIVATGGDFGGSSKM